ncbi:MAG: hypothetical protein AAFU73_13970 [Planctomycetota bacterium]
MRKRFTDLLVAELLAFGAFVLVGLACVGAVRTAGGDSQLAGPLSWLAVATFATLGAASAWAALGRFKSLFRRTRPAAPASGGLAPRS